MPELGLSSKYDYSTATSNRKKSIFLVIGVNRKAFGIPMEAIMGSCHVLYMTKSLFYTDISTWMWEATGQSGIA